MIPENVTEKVNGEERRDTQKIEMAVATIRRTLAGRIPVGTTLETHGQILRALASIINPNENAAAIPELTPGAPWYVLSQFSQSLRSILHIKSTRTTIGDLLAEVDYRLSGRE